MGLNQIGDLLQEDKVTHITRNLFLTLSANGKIADYLKVHTPSHWRVAVNNFNAPKIMYNNYADVSEIRKNTTPHYNSRYYDAVNTY
jgi:hypothetical protein